MRSLDEVLGLLSSRRLLRGPELDKQRSISRHYNSDIALPLPELDKEEMPAVANLIAVGIDGHAQRVASVLPEITFPPRDLTSTQSVKRGADRRRAALGWLEQADYDLLLHQRARYLVAYGTTPIIVRPNPATKGVSFDVRNPLDTYPAIARDPTDMLPDDAIFTYLRTMDWLVANYPEKAALLARTVQNPNALSRRDYRIQIIEYRDKEQTMLAAGGSGALTWSLMPDTFVISAWNTSAGPGWAIMLKQSPNLTGRTNVIVPRRVTLDKLKGQFDDMTGIYQMQAKLMGLDVHSIARSVFPDTYWVMPEGSAGDIVYANGLKGKIGSVEGGSLQTIQSQPGLQVGPTLDRLERAQRIAGAVISEMTGECVCEDTEILTDSGWKSYGEIGVGTEVLTLNHDTGQSEWQPILKMNVFEAEPRTLIEMKGPRFSSLTTQNHRWPVIKYTGERVWKTSTTLSQSDKISLAAPNAHLPLEPKWSDALVELVGWYWTEGTTDGGHTRIAQSTKKADNCNLIRAALTAAFGPAVEAFPRTGRTTDGIPRWREPAPTPNSMVNFSLNADAGRIVREFAPGSEKIPTYEFLRSLTQSQLDLFIETSMLADNCGNVEARRALGQANIKGAEAFGFACILAGRPVSYRVRTRTETRTSNSWRERTYDTHIIQLRKRDCVKPIEAARRSDGAMIVREVQHDGITWCPTVGNGSFLARRKGSVYFTGNSPTNIRTDTRGQSVAAASIDFHIYEHQMLLAKSLKRELEAGIEVQTAYFGDSSQSFFVNWPNAQGYVDYVPNKIFGDSKVVLVEYAQAGYDAQTLATDTGQRVAVGLMSRKTGMQRDPAIKDAEREHGQVLYEHLEDALVQRVQTEVSQPGALPTQSMIQLMKLVQGTTPLADAYEQVHNALQKQQAAAQAQQPAPADPNAQPGLDAGTPAAAALGVPSVGSPPVAADNLRQALRDVKAGAAV